MNQAEEACVRLMKERGYVVVGIPSTWLNLHDESEIQTSAVKHFAGHELNNGTINLTEETTRKDWSEQAILLFGSKEEAAKRLKGQRGRYWRGIYEPNVDPKA